MKRYLIFLFFLVPMFISVQGMIVDYNKSTNFGFDNLISIHFLVNLVIALACIVVIAFSVIELIAKLYVVYYVNTAMTIVRSRLKIVTTEKKKLECNKQLQMIKEIKYRIASEKCAGWTRDRSFIMSIMDDWYSL